MTARTASLACKHHDRPGQTRKDQDGLGQTRTAKDREDFNLADLLELAFMFFNRQGEKTYPHPDLHSKEEKCERGCSSVKSGEPFAMHLIVGCPIK